MGKGSCQAEERSANSQQRWDQNDGDVAARTTQVEVQSSIVDHVCVDQNGANTYIPSTSMPTHDSCPGSPAAGGGSPSGGAAPSAPHGPDQNSTKRLPPIQQAHVDGLAKSPSYDVTFRAKATEGWRDRLTVFIVAGLLVPFFTVLGPCILASLFLVYAQWGTSALTAFAVVIIGNGLLAPPIYSATFKNSIFRPLLLELLSYVKNFRVLKAQELDNSRTYVFCWHPHGRLFYGFAVFCGLFHAIVCPELSNQEFFGGINDLLFTIPFVGNMLHLTGLIPCGRKHVDKKLRQGNHVGLIVGGVEEVLEGTFDDRDVLWLAKRKGFVKVAMDQGAGLVPVFAFGENNLFKHERTSTMSFWRIFNRFVKIGAPFPIRGPMSLPIPYRRELIIAVGPPLFALPGETVDAMHARYVAAVTELHRANVGQTSQPDRKLVIV